MSAPLLEARGLCVRRGDGFAVQVPSLIVEAGEVLVLLGPNGAGKSTLLQALALLERPDAGDLLLGGASTRRDRLAARRRMAVVLQEPLLVHGSVRDNVTLGMRLQRLPRAERDRRAALWMERTGVAHLARRPARALSGGEQRRVSLARALALDPLVLFMDEPFAALDAPSRRALLAELPGWLRAAGCATVLVTHDREEALTLADRVAVMFAGGIRQTGRVDEVFAHPADEEVAAFLGVENILAGELLDSDGELARVRIGALELVAAGALPPGPALVTVHPELIVLFPAGEAPRSSARNLLDCRIASVEPAGSLVRVHLDAGAPLVATVTRASAADLGLAPGVQVVAAIKASAVNVVPKG